MIDDQLVSFGPIHALGIPGSVIDAILLGAFVIHGLQPGPMLFTNDPKIVGTIISSYLWANLAMLFLMLLSARWAAKLARISRPVETSGKSG